MPPRNRRFVTAPMWVGVQGSSAARPDRRRSGRARKRQGRRRAAESFPCPRRGAERSEGRCRHSSWARTYLANGPNANRADCLFERLFRFARFLLLAPPTAQNGLGVGDGRLMSGDLDNFFPFQEIMGKRRRLFSSITSVTASAIAISITASSGRLGLRRSLRITM